VFFLREDGQDAAGNMLITRTNAPGAWVGGLNVEGKLALQLSTFNFQLSAGYTYQQSRYTEAQQWSPDIAPQTKMLRTPDNYAYVLWDIEPVRDFTVSVNGKATGSMLVPHLAGCIAQDEEINTPVFWDMGIRLAYDIHLYKHYCLEVSAGVKNVLDQFQTDLDKGPDRDADYVYGPTQPRTWFAGLRLKL
jgi:outer membrane receptor for ferrienterochelin and colicins